MKRSLLKPLHHLFLWVASALMLVNLTLGHFLPQQSNLIAQSDRQAETTETSQPSNPQTQKDSEEQAKSDSADKQLQSQSQSGRTNAQSTSRSPGPYDMEEIKRFNRELYGS